MTRNERCEGQLWVECFYRFHDPEMRPCDEVAGCTDALDADRCELVAMPGVRVFDHVLLVVYSARGLLVDPTRGTVCELNVGPQAALAPAALSRWLQALVAAKVWTPREWQSWWSWCPTPDRW